MGIATKRGSGGEKGGGGEGVRQENAKVTRGMRGGQQGLLLSYQRQYMPVHGEMGGVQVSIRGREGRERLAAESGGVRSRKHRERTGRWIRRARRAEEDTGGRASQEQSGTRERMRAQRGSPCGPHTLGD